jgi:hypothetical protein
VKLAVRGYLVRKRVKDQVEVRLLQEVGLSSLVDLWKRVTKRLAIRQLKLQLLLPPLMIYISHILFREGFNGIIESNLE